MGISAKSFKELVSLTEKVADRFFMAKQMWALKQKETIHEIDEEAPYLAYLVRVEKAYSSLSEQDQNLINNEFFYQNYRYWWVGIYSKASFYRLKKQAMLNFLEAIYHV